MASRNDRKSLNQQPWDELQRDYVKNGVALALGAGVSVGCNLPNWCQLLERIAVRFYGKVGQSLVSEMIAEGYPLPSIASMLEIDCPSGSDFGEVIRDALYEKFPFYPDGVKVPADFVKYVKASNKTLGAVAALCTRRVAGSFVANSNIHSIVNSNYDATLRAYARARYQRNILRTVERPSAGFRRGRINMYHVHGFFQFQKDKRTSDEEAPDIRVFTEQEYFDFFNQPNSLFNYTFLYLLREYNVLFIGMSLMDENIRRLLHYSRKEIRESYEKEKESSEAAEQKSLRHYSIQKRRKSDTVNDMTEKSLRRLGVRSLWIEKFNQIPERLEGLYESTGAQWGDVY
jgi:SIR2-like domain